MERGGGVEGALNLLTFPNPYLVCRNLFSLYNVRVRLSLSVRGLAFTSRGLNFRKIRLFEKECFNIMVNFNCVINYDG